MRKGKKRETDGGREGKEEGEGVGERKGGRRGEGGEKVGALITETRHKFFSLPDSKFS